MVKDAVWLGLFRLNQKRQFKGDEMWNMALADDKEFSRSGKLVDEILASQQQRADLLKWKLIIVAAVGAAAMGLGDNMKRPYFMLLALIPLTCAYVDLLCSNINIRIIIIGEFFRDSQACPYESYLHQLNHGDNNRYVLEDWALYFSTYAISLVVLIFGAVKGPIGDKWMPYPSLVVSGLLGILLGLFVKRKYDGLKASILKPKVPQRG